MGVTSIADRDGADRPEETEPTWVHPRESLAEREAEDQERAVGAAHRCVPARCARPRRCRRPPAVGCRRPARGEADPAAPRLHAWRHRIAWVRVWVRHRRGRQRSAAIPAAVRDTVLTAVSGQVQLIFRDLGVPTDGWATGLRSVMYGVERRGRPDRMAALAAALGEQALSWPQAGAGPVRLLDVLPLAVCGGFSSSGKRSSHADGPALPEELSRLWQTDLLLGGASVVPTDQVRAVVSNQPYAATAWVSASLKYRSMRLPGCTWASKRPSRRRAGDCWPPRYAKYKGCPW